MKYVILAKGQFLPWNSLAALNRKPDKFCVGTGGKPFPTRSSNSSNIPTVTFS